MREAAAEIVYPTHIAEWDYVTIDDVDCSLLLWKSGISLILDALTVG
jgi:hypothetical protein